MMNPIFIKGTRDMTGKSPQESLSSNRIIVVKIPD